MSDIEVANLTENLLRSVNKKIRPQVLGRLKEFEYNIGPLSISI